MFHWLGLRPTRAELPNVDLREKKVQNQKKSLKIKSWFLAFFHSHAARGPQSKKGSTALQELFPCFKMGHKGHHHHHHHHHEHRRAWKRRGINPSVFGVAGGYNLNLLVDGTRRGCGCGRRECGGCERGLGAWGGCSEHGAFWNNWSWGAAIPPNVAGCCGREFLGNYCQQPGYRLAAAGVYVGPNGGAYRNFSYAAPGLGGYISPGPGYGAGAGAVVGPNGGIAKYGYGPNGAVAVGPNGGVYGAGY